MADKLGRKVAPELAKLRAKVGSAAMRGNREQEIQYRQELKAAVLEQRIREALATDPPLTDAQRAKLVTLLEVSEK